MAKAKKTKKTKATQARSKKALARSKKVSAKTASSKSKSAQSQQKSEPKATAAFSVSLNVDSATPKKPHSKEIQSAFLRAWTLIPVHRRPEIPSAYLKRIAVDIILVTDDKIAELNAAHLKHKGATDVLSFPLGEFDPERCVFNLGEIIVSYETAQQESRTRALPYEEEVLRYCVHGFLHLLGYDDSTRTQREEMFEVQEKAVCGK